MLRITTCKQHYELVIYDSVSSKLKTKSFLFGHLMTDFNILDKDFSSKEKIGNSP